MRTITYGVEGLQARFHFVSVLTLEEVKEALGASSRMTAIRKLRALRYRSSYSHAGKYYTLQEIARYDRHGLWSFRDIRFSRYGCLQDTLIHLIEASWKGYFAGELERLVNVPVHNALARVWKNERVLRQQIGGAYVYLSKTAGEGQLEHRKESIQKECAQKESLAGPLDVAEELAECLEDFLSLLDERQKRLYLGLESMKYGYGGDAVVSRLTGVNVKTIAQGRQELLSKDITPDRVRRAGGGRRPLKKNCDRQGAGNADG